MSTMSKTLVDGYFVAQNLLLKAFTSMALQAMFDLGIPDILAAADGRKPLSAEEILQKLPTKSTPGPTSARNLQRLLSHLVSEGVFSESVNGDEQPVYGLTEVSEWYIRGSQPNIVATADLMFCAESMACQGTLHEGILDETTHPFLKANGAPVYEYNEQTTYGSLFNKAMESSGKMFLALSMESLLENLRVDGVNTLVDVGGNKGHIISEVVSRHPHIKGINYDLPYVIAQAPVINGVEHVAGSFFESVPSGDALFLKWITHNYADDKAIQILKNCFKALPVNGKVILGEYIVDKNDKSPVGRYVQQVDLIMLIFLQGARERSKEEYEEILLAAGFSNVKFTPIGGGMSLIEGFKK